jgi:RimJ/RimL family protein N-acetyltransferase
MKSDIMDTREHLQRDLSNWQPRPRPERRVMEGRYVRLEPLDAARHGEELFIASTVEDAPQRFRWLPELPPASREAFAPWLATAEASPDPMYFAVIDRATGRVGGRQTLMRIEPRHGTVEIGHIYWGPLISRRPASTEAFYLCARHVFDELGYRRFEWKCNNRNTASKNAALRYGMAHEGVFRQHMVVKGENRDTAWYSMLDAEWPAARRAMERWLDPQNFDPSGSQIRRLEDIRAEGA